MVELASSLDEQPMRRHAVSLPRGSGSQHGGAGGTQALGVAVDLGPQSVARCVREAGVGFMYAPRYHPAMAAVRRVRKELGVTTPPPPCDTNRQCHTHFLLSLCRVREAAGSCTRCGLWISESSAQEATSSYP